MNMINNPILATGKVECRYTKRGQRIFIEGGKAAKAGFTRHGPYTRTITSGKIVLTVGGDRKCSGRVKNGVSSPTIDISMKQIGDFATGEKLSVTYYNGSITIERIAA
ncbi:hypothetical protein OAA60_00905 [Porticoccaceae bacterium]|nr:hypothetical protein [Porticoccaceae bacterium]